MSTDTTRDTVLAAANGLRAADPSSSDESRLDAALRDIIASGIALGTGETVETFTAYPAVAGDDADGVLIDVRTRNASTDATRTRTIAAVAASDGALTLTGSTVLQAAPIDSDAAPSPVVSTPLTGAVVVTAPLDTDGYGVLRLVASGATTGASSGTTSQKVPDPKTSAQKKAAKATYTQRVKAARKTYAKAIKKAGGSKRRKKAAKSAYARKVASAKAQYAAATAGYRIVTVPAAGAESRPFSLTITTDFVV